MDKFTTEEITIKSLFQSALKFIEFAKKKLTIILLTGFVGAILGLCYSYISQITYTAKLTFALEEKSNSSVSGLSSIASSFGLNLGGGESGAFAGDNIIELMKSRLMIEKTLLTQINYNDKNELLINRYIDRNFNNKIFSINSDRKFLTYIDNNRKNYTREQDSLLGEIQADIAKNKLEINKIDKKLSIISVKINANDELFAKSFCENLVKNVTDFYIETKVGKSRKNIQLLQSRVDSVKRELDDAMYGRAIFTDQNFGLIKQKAAIPKLKQEMRVQMLATMYGELVKNLEFSKLALMREEPLIQIIDYPILPLQHKHVSKLISILIGFLMFSFFSLVFYILKDMFLDLKEY